MTEPITIALSEFQRKDFEANAASERAILRDRMLMSRTIIARVMDPSTLDRYEVVIRNDTLIVTPKEVPNG